MEENKGKNTSANTEKIKKETANTVNEVKETIKKVNFKKDTIATKGYLKEIFTNPLGKIKDIVDDDSNKVLKYVIIVLAVWLIAIFVQSIFSMTGTWKYIKFGKNILTIIKSILAPLISVIAMSVIIMVFNKGNKKKLTTIISAVTTAKVPVVISSILSLTILISSQMTKITIPFASFCNAISIVLMYFVAKSVITTEKNSEFIKKFILIEACYYAVYFVFTFLGIYI